MSTLPVILRSSSLGLWAVTCCSFVCAFGETTFPLQCWPFHSPPVLSLIFLIFPEPGYFMEISRPLLLPSASPPCRRSGSLWWRNGGMYVDCNSDGFPRDIQAREKKGRPELLLKTPTSQTGWSIIMVSAVKIRKVVIKVECDHRKTSRFAR